MNEPLAHGACAVEPGAQDDPTKQSVHSVTACRPRLLEYVPAGQGVHSLDPATLNWPGAQAIGSLERARQKLPSGHASHVDAPPAL